MNGTLDMTPFRQAGEQLRRCDEAIKEFRFKHMYTIGGVTVYHTDVLTNRIDLDNEWKRLLRARDKAWKLHQQLMKENAEQKGSAA
jgi:hypothetical protein